MNEAAVAPIQWWQQTYDDDWTVAEMLAKLTGDYADLPVLELASGERLSHAVIHKRAACVRTSLAEKLPARSVVAVLLPLGAEYMVAVCAVFSSDYVFTALDPDSPPERNLKILEATNAKLLLTNDGCMESAQQLSTRYGIELLSIQATYTQAPTPANISVRADDIAALLATSGSTGEPKIVVRSHRSYSHAIYSFGALTSAQPGELILTVGSPAYVGTLNACLTVLLNGQCVRAFPANDTNVVEFEAFARHNPVNQIDCSPALLRLLTAAPEARINNPAIRRVFTSGAALLKSDVNRFQEVFGRHVELVANYGSTEAGPMICGRYRDQIFAGDGGTPLSNLAHGCQLEIIDESGELVGVGQEGSIRVRSKYFAQGYLNAPEQTQATFKNDHNGAYLLTGDRGYFDENGQLTILGRADRQFSRHGRRFDYGEIEVAIRSQGEWADAVVDYCELPDRQAMLVVLVKAHHQNACVDALRDYLYTELPPAAIPSRYIAVNSIPKTASGKVDYAACRRLILGKVTLHPDGLGGPPQGTLENWLADCWEELFNCRRPGRDDNFFSMGGDSLAAMQLITLLEQRFGYKLALDQFAESQTIAKQAQLLTSTQRQSKPLICLRQGKPDTDLMILIPGVGGHAWVFGHILRHLQSELTVYGVSFQALLADVPRANEQNFHRVLASKIKELAEQRRVIIAGYSLGAVLATQQIQYLAALSIRVHKLLLIDPMQSGSWLHGAKKMFLRNRRQLASAKPQHELRYLLDSEIAQQAKVLKRIARRQPQLTGIDVSVLYSRDSQSEALAAWVRGANTKHLHCGHLALMRPPYAEETATWLDRQLVCVNTP